MRGAWLAAALAFASPANAAERFYMSLAQYIELEREAVDKAKGSPVVTTYLGGVIEALGIANEALRKEGQKPLFCMQSGLSAETLRRFINAFIAGGSMSAQDSLFFQQNINVGAVSVVVLRENLPCSAAAR
jgi:hypothetical protein